MHAHPETADERPPSRWCRVALLAISHPVLTVACLALLARLTVITVLEVTVGGSLFEDDSTYPVLAAQRAAGHTATWGDYEYSLYEATATFLAPLTAVYRVFGPSVLLGQLLAAAFATVAAAAAARATLLALPGPYALGAGTLVALMPSQVLFSSLVLKDAAVWAVLATTALVCALLSRAGARSLLPLLFGLAGLLWLLSHLRLHTLVAASCAAALAAWVAPGRLRLVRGAGALVVCTAVPFLVGIGPLGYDLVKDALGTLEERRQANAVGAATAFVTPDAFALPRGLRVLLLEPLPGQVDGNPRVLLALLENLLWWPLLLLALTAIPVARRHLPVLAFPILCGGAVVLLYALAEGNFGTAYRHRGEVVWAVAMLAAFGAESLTARRRGSRPAVVAAGRIPSRTPTAAGGDSATTPRLSRL